LGFNNPGKWSVTALSDAFLILWKKEGVKKEGRALE
jgi:hypothetical protein